MRRTWVLAAVLAQACALPEATHPSDGSPGAAASESPPDEPITGTAPRSMALVARVVDGDTFVAELGGEELRVRLIGVDAPEVSECFGTESTRFVRRRLERRRVRLEFDVERTDRFGRTLAYAWGRGGLFNRLLVSRGFALAVAYPPNVRYQDLLEGAELTARGGRRGLWGRCR